VVRRKRVAERQERRSNSPHPKGLWTLAFLRQMGCGCGKSKFKDKVEAKLTQQPTNSQQNSQTNQKSSQNIQNTQSPKIQQIPPMSKAERILARKERIKKREERIARRQRAERIRAIKQRREEQSKKL